MAKLQLIMASNCHCEGAKDFSEVRRMVYAGDKDASKTSEEIINETLRKHNITLV